MLKLLSIPRSAHKYRSNNEDKRYRASSNGNDKLKSQLKIENNRTLFVLFKSILIVCSLRYETDANLATKRTNLSQEPVPTPIPYVKTAYSNDFYIKLYAVVFVSGGRGGIRTPGGLAPSTVFKTAAFNRSATLP